MSVSERVEKFRLPANRPALLHAHQQPLKDDTVPDYPFRKRISAGDGMVTIDNAAGSGFYIAIATTGPASFQVFHYGSCP